MFLIIRVSVYVCVYRMWLHMGVYVYLCVHGQMDKYAYGDFVNSIYYIYFVCISIRLRFKVFA